MEKKILRKALHRTVCAALVLGVVLQIGIPATHAVYARTGSLKDELSKNGNVVTEYVNEDDHQSKTILWTKGINPPKMGGEDSQFQKYITYDKNGKIDYIDYISPYLPGNGWYDVNKSKNYEQMDLYLCFAAAAANSLHWWMDRNAQYIDKYLELNPDNAQIQKLNDLRFSFANQHKSGVYDVFLRQFANKQDGYWPDILQDQFINGYYPKPNGGTNDSPADQDKLMNQGPDPNGGFFFDVFHADRLTQRRYYENGFEAINRELKEILLNGDLVLMTYRVGGNSHVVTLWGAEYDQNGNICAVYCTDSDDEYSQGMVRLRLVNAGGKAVVTTQVDGKGNSAIQALQILSTGTSQWQKYLAPTVPVTTLNLTWSDLEHVYDGQIHVPTVTATNVNAEDDVILSVEGGQIDAGVYKATAVLSGSDAYKYALPAAFTCSFEIKKAPAPQITYPSAGTIQYGQKLADSILTGGSVEYGRFYWQNAELVPEVHNAGYVVEFVPSDATKQNYEPLQSVDTTVPVVVEKAMTAMVIDAKVQANLVTLTGRLTPAGYGETPTGTVTFVITDENGQVVKDDLVGTVDADGRACATWEGAPLGNYRVTGYYSGNDNYCDVTAGEITVDVQKQSQTGFQIQNVAPKTYGDGEFLLETVGGSGSGNVTFESSDPGVISISGNTATIQKAGTVTIIATKAGNETYNAAKAIISVVVNKKNLTVTAEDKQNVGQGASMPEFTYRVEGLVNGDLFDAPILSVPVTNTEVPGEYEISICGGNLTNAESYAVTYVSGTMSVHAAKVPDVPVVPSNPADNNNLPEKDHTENIQPSLPAESASGESVSAPAENTELSHVDVPKEDKLDSVAESAEATSQDENVAVAANAEPTTVQGSTEPAETSPAESLTPEENTTESKGIQTAVIVLLVVVILAAVIVCAILVKRKLAQKDA